MTQSNNPKKDEKKKEQTQNEKKKEDKKTVVLSEEDEKHMKDLELIVERIKDINEDVQKMALKTLQNELTSTTSSVTSVPKPLKFLADHYEPLKTFHESMKDGENKTLLADIISVLAMIYALEGSRDGLKFKLQGSLSLLEWGHEYLRFLSGEISAEYQARVNENPDLTDHDVQDILKLVDNIVPLLMNSNAESDACDLLLEVEKLEKIVEQTDANNYTRVCMYLTSASKYFLDPENIQILKVVFTIFRKLKKFPEALRVAIMMNAGDLVEETFKSCDDKATKMQLAFMIARHGVKFKADQEDEDVEEDEDMEDEEEIKLKEIMDNTKLSEHFIYLAKELDTLEPKTYEDIYKSHLTETRSTLSQNVDSARQNLAATFVNAFVNAGFGTDKLVTDPKTQWLYKNKDHGKISAAASLGMIYLWNTDLGHNNVDKFDIVNDNYIKAGVSLAHGILSSGVKDEMDTAYALLSENVEGTDRDSRLAAILGLGIAYAGSAKNTVNELLMTILADGEQPMEVVAFTALALGLVFIGTCHEDISTTIIQVLMEREDSLNTTVIRFLCLGLGLLFLGKQEAADAMIETTKTLHDSISKYVANVVETCAYAGTGNVLKIQQLLKICGEHLEEPKQKEKEPAQQQQQQQQQQQDSKNKEVNNKHQGVAVLGISLIAMGEELGTEMAARTFDHLLQYGDPVVKRAVPLALGLLNVSNPKMTLIDTLSKLSHDSDMEIAENAILAMGLIGAGTNNARIAQILRLLSTFYSKEPNVLFMVRIAQGILFAGKGLITLSPYYSDRSIMSPVAVGGLLTILTACLDIKNTILSQYHFLLYFLVCAMRPRMLLTLDEDLKPISTSVRVGTAVDVVAQAGKPKTITGFQTHNTPVLLQYEDRAELATEEYIALTPVLEDVVILKKNPEFDTTTSSSSSSTIKM